MKSKIDVLICLNYLDLNELFLFSLKSCINKFKLLNNIYIVTNNKKLVVEYFKEAKLSNKNIIILKDEDVLYEMTSKLDGWYKQQIIKLNADKICSTDYVCCLSSDTIILREININHLFRNNKPIIYFNRYRHPSNHLVYERKRVENVAKILKTVPAKSYLLGDFILDFTLFDIKILKSLKEYLFDIYGNDFFVKIIKNDSIIVEYKGIVENKGINFGEWTLYAVFVLDVLKLDWPLKNSFCRYFNQIHNTFDLLNNNFNEAIVHFVDKEIDIELIKDKLIQFNLF